MRREDGRNKKDIRKKKATKEKNCRIHETYIKSGG